MQSNVLGMAQRQPAQKSLLKSKTLTTLALLLMLGWQQAPAQSEPLNRLQLPQRRPQPITSAAVSCEPDVLLVLASPAAEEDEIDEALKACHGTVIGTIGQGAMTVLKVQVEKGTLLETEKKLSKDKNFAVVQRNFVFHAQATATNTPVNDPQFPNQWHLSAMNVVPSWQFSQGSKNILAVLDTGCNTGIKELSGKSYSGYDALKLKMGQSDSHGHGTMVATTAAANTNNGTNTAAPARLTNIYPIKISDPKGYTTESAVLEAVYKAGSLGIKMINLSFNATPPYSFASRQAHPLLHTYFQWYHDQIGGLIFNAAGNEATADNSPFAPYLIVVSALNPQFGMAYFSNYGSPIWFTAPGVDIYCSNKKGKSVAASGTSFSSPLCAGVAALVWGANPSLRNTDVENILKQTSYKSSSGGWTPYFGFGMPNAAAAVKLATGQ